MLFLHSIYQDYTNTSTIVYNCNSSSASDNCTVIVSLFVEWDYSQSLYVMAENKCLVIEDNPVALCCAPWLSLSLTSLGNRWCLRTMLSCILFSHWQQHHFPLCDKDIFQTEVIQTVIYHLRELSLRTEVEGSDKDECPTNAISNCSCVSSGTWTEIDTLNRGQASRSFFSPLYILQKDYHVEAGVLVGVAACASTEQRWNSQASRPVYCLWWQCCTAA